MKNLIILTCLLLAACTSPEISFTDKLSPRETAIEDKQWEESDGLLKAIWEHAKEGKIKETRFNVLQHGIEDVKHERGDPDRVDKAGYGFYATYEDEELVFGYNQEGELFDLRSYSFDKEITYEEIKSQFGEADETRTLSGEKIYVYHLDTVELKWIVSEQGKTVDHISVFNPERAILEEEYILDIRGVSNRLSPSAWENMKKWRRDIVQFAKENENTFINGPNKKMVALTFDDGPDTQVTPAIIDTLETYDVPGNFFFLGEKVLENKQVVKDAYNKGHLILSHSFHHIDLTKLSEQEVVDEMERASEAIRTVTGQVPLFIRTPYGETDEKVAGVANRLGYTIVLWSIDTLDWSQQDAENIAQNVLGNVRNGDIILLHSNEEQKVTAEALPAIIEGLLAKGFQIVDLETLLGAKATIIK